MREVVREFARRFDFVPNDVELNLLGNSLPQWSPFPDTVEALSALRQQYKIAIVSNWPGHFHELLRRTGLPKEAHLHAAESLYHDIAPTRELGIRNVWVQRSHRDDAKTASRVVPVVPDVTVQNLAELADLLL